MKLLLPAYYFPPAHVIGAVRIRHLYEGWQRHGAEVYVLTTGNRHLMRQDPSLALEEVRLTEIPTRDLRRLVLKRQRGKVSSVPQQSKSRWWLRLARRLADSFPFLLFLADGGIGYIWRGYRVGARLVREQGITHVLSSYRPYADLLIGYLLRRRFPQLVWVADFRDLPVDPAVGNVLWPAFQHWCLRRLLARADLVTTVSEGLARHLQLYGRPVYVLRNGIGAGDMATGTAEPSEIFTITYTGALFGEKRDPMPLLEALKALIAAGMVDRQKIGIRYAGPDGDAWTPWLEASGLAVCFHDLGQLPRDQARRLQRQSQLNLLLTYTSPELQGNLTGKLYEYLAARRPIVAIINGPADPEMEVLFRELNAGLVVYPQQEHIEALQAFITEKFQEWQRSGNTPPSIREEDLASLRWDHLMDLFFQHLEKISPPHVPA